MANKAITMQGGDGTAVPAGMVGETVAGTGTTTNSISANTTYTAATVTLNKGVWLLIGRAVASPPTGSDAADDVIIDITTDNGANAASTTESNARYTVNQAHSLLGTDIYLNTVKYLVITGDATPVYLKMNVITKTNTVNITSSKQYLRAVRIA